MKRGLILSLLIIIYVPLRAQKDSVWKKSLKEITIATERNEIHNLGIRTDKPDSLLTQFYYSNTLANMLDAASGLVIRSYGPGILATTSLRGGNAQQTALSWNGISINNPVNGLSDLNLIPSFLFDNASILPGLSGSLQGSGAISGVINLKNYIPKPHSFSADVMQSFASFGTYSEGLKFQYSKNKWTYATKIYYSKAENNYPFNNSAEAGNPKQNQTNAKSKSLSLISEIGYQTLRNGNIKISYWSTLADRQIPPAIFMINSNAQQYDNIKKTMLQWDKSFKKMSTKIRTLWQHDYLKYSEPQIDINSISKSDFMTNDVELRFKFIKNASTSAGLIQSFAKATVANVLNYETTIFNKSNRNQVAVWASHFQQFPSIRTQISVSVRQELVDIKLLPFIPSTGFKTKVNKNFNIYAQTGRVYRIPTLNDLHWFPGGNTQLKPESGWASEFTTDFHKKNKRIEYSTSLTTFMRIINNWIQWQPLTVQIWSPVNIGKVNSRGLEFRNNIKIALSKKNSVKVGLNFDYTKSENREINKTNYGKQLLYIPFYKASAFVGFGYHNSVLLIQNIWVGKRYTTSDNKESIPSYGLLNIAINQIFKFKEINGYAFFKINNIFKKSYEAIAWRPMPGINFEIGIGINFQNQFFIPANF